jgi:type VI secretion system secreted protein Hcp
MKFTHILIIFGLVLVGSVFLTSDAYGAGFMKLGDIKGEATEEGHKDWINLLSFIEVSTTDEPFTDRTREETSLGDIIVVKELDKSSPKLAEATLSGKTFPKVEIQMKTSDGKYATYELTNVMITTYSVSGDADDRPTEEISFTFEKLVLVENKDSQTTDKIFIDESTKNLLTDSKPRVPIWVQTTAQFWIDKNVSDREFTDALGFLVKEKIIEVEVETQSGDAEQPPEEPQVPAWIATTTKWWVDGQVPEDQFLEGIKWMIKNNIIRGL